MDKTKPRNNNKLRNILCLILCVAILGVFLTLIANQADAYNALQAQYDIIQENLARQVAIYEDLQYQLAHFDSDSYIEALARERFGWVRPNEIVFRMITD